MLFLQLAATDATSLAPHRTKAGWDVSVVEDCIWLRCPDQALVECASLPCLGRYRSSPAGQLIPLQATLPVMNSPAGPWQPLREFISIPPTPAGMPGRTRDKIRVRLVRSDRVAPAEALLLPVTELAAWTGQASRLRMEKLRFAASPDGRAFVIGHPLPPVPGVPYYKIENLALPCGWDFAPSIWRGWVKEVLAVPTDGLALVHEDARIEIIGAEGFTPLTLAAMRRTLAQQTSRSAS